MDDRTPSGQAVLPQPNRHPAVGVDREDLGGVPCAGTEVRGSGLGEHDGCFAAVGGQASEDVVPVGQQNIPAFGSGAQADEEHETRRVRDTRTLGVRFQVTVPEPGEARAVGVDTGVVNGGQPVRVAVGVWRDAHQPGGEAQDRGAGREPVDGHQAGVLQLGGD